MSQVFPVIALSDPTKLASLTEEQRLHVASALAGIAEDMQALIAQVDEWLAAPPEPEPVPLGQDHPAIVFPSCHWCPREAVGHVEQVVLGIPVGLRPAGLTPKDPQGR